MTTEPKEGKKELERCGACGVFNDDPDKYTKGELENAPLTHCGCEAEGEQRRVTRDMAIDAGDLSLEGQII